MTKSLGDATKAAFRGTFVARNIYFKMIYFRFCWFTTH